jgi:Putative MetA-pathway of phenol degradation
VWRQSRSLATLFGRVLSRDKRHGRSTPVPLFVLLPTIIFLSCTAHAQQPFSTDDADVTEKKKFHLEISNEFDILQRSTYPALRQNTVVFALNYGLVDGVEIGVDYPLIAISNSRIVSQRQIVGFGDLDFHVKYNFLKERGGSWRPALTVTLAVEVPTGDAARGLGSGFKDFALNSIVQKSITDKTKVRANGGIVFAGSTATGDIGIKARGRVFVAGVSLVRQFTEKLDLGVEVTAAKSSSIQASHGLRQTMVGGNYQVTPRMSFDFGVLAGNFNSPRAGVLVGISLDF